MRRKLLCSCLVLVVLFFAVQFTQLSEDPYKIIDTATASSVEAFSFQSGEEVTFAVEYPRGLWNNPSITVESDNDALTLTTQDNGATLSAIGTTDGVLTVTFSADNLYDPVSTNLAWNCSLGTQDISLSAVEIDEVSIEATTLASSASLTAELIEASDLYEGTKAWLQWQLDAGEHLTVADLVELVDVSSFTDGCVNVAMGYSTQFQFTTQEGANSTYTVDAGIAAVLCEGDIYTITPVGVGSTTLTFTTTLDNYEPVVTEIPITVTAPPAMLISLASDMANDTFEVEIDASESAQYFVYPADSTILATSADESVATASATMDAETATATASATGLALGQTTLAVQASADGYATTTLPIAAEVVPTKTPFVLSASGLSNGKFGITLADSQTIAYTLESGAALTLTYDTSALQIEDTGDGLAITALAEGTYILTATATHSDYYDNTQTIIVTCSKEPVSFSIETSVLTINAVEAPKTVALYSGTEGVTYTVETSTGITATLDSDGAFVAISGTQSGAITITAAAEGYQSVTHVINATYAQPDIAFDCALEDFTLIAETLDTAPSAEFSLAVTNASAPNISVSVTEGNGSAVYTASDATNGVISVSGAEGFRVNISITADGYNSTTKSIWVSYQSPSVPITLSESSVSLSSTNTAAAVTVSTGAASDATITVSSSNGNVSPTYSNGTITITATGSGEVYVYASSSGYNTAQKTITVSYANSTTTATTSQSSFAAEVLRLVNVERAAYGLSALSSNSYLTAAAEIRAGELQSSFSHTRPNGTSCFTALDEVGYTSYRTAGENVAYGQTSPQEVVSAWMNSEGHRANILNADFTMLGVGVVQGSNGTYYWAQMFAG